jgi:hypothetical protein
MAWMQENSCEETPISFGLAKMKYRNAQIRMKMSTMEQKEHFPHKKDWQFKTVVSHHQFEPFTCEEFKVRC